MNNRQEHRTHIQIALLLDEYTTNELEAEEQDMVEQHVVYCQECQQQLRDIQRFRIMMKSIARDNVQLPNEVNAVSTSHETANLVEAVHRGIDEEVTATTSLSKTKTFDKSLSELPKTNARTNEWSRPTSNIAAALFAALLVGSIILTLTHARQVTINSTPGLHREIVGTAPTPGTALTKPGLDKLEVVTEQAFGTKNEYVPNSWGVQKNRIIRTTTGDLFTVFISQGDDAQDRQWHLIHKAPDGNWQEIKTGNAGVEPINILRGPRNEIHLFAWPGNQGQLQHLISSDGGKSFQSEWIPGAWAGQQEQGYSGSGINERGDIVFFQTGTEKSGVFNWTYYNATKHIWTFHSNTFDYRYTYAFVIPGGNNDLTMVAMRDVIREELGYPAAPRDDFDYVYNAIKYFHVSNVDNPKSTFTQTMVKEVHPRNNTDYAITYLTDSYIDTQGRTHILYNDLYDGPHHAIIQDGRVIKDVRQNIVDGNKMRIIQDTKGRFYIISVDDHGMLNIYHGGPNDTDGTQLEPATKLNVSQHPGCTNYDFCHSPTFTVPRNGHALADYIDGVYGNYQSEIYFRVRLR